MSTLFIISGVTGMTGNELARKMIKRGDHVIGFDNFFASSLDTVRDILSEPGFEFYEMARHLSFSKIVSATLCIAGNAARNMWFA